MKKCTQCLKETKLFIDHNHNTNIVRGLLCTKCNTGLGLFCENIAILNNSISYIRNTR